MATNNVPDRSAMQTFLLNEDRRNVILRTGLRRRQQIYSAATNPASQTTINIPPHNVGLIIGFIIKVEGTITNTNVGTSGVALTRTPFGAANALGNMQFTDFNAVGRHNTQGWHVTMLNSARQPAVFGAAYSPNVPVGFGANWDVMTAPNTIAAGADGALQYYYYLPASMSPVDLRGAVWAGMNSATANIQLQINSTPVVASGDAGLAIYSGNTGGWKSGTSVTITVHQVYIDQVPMTGGNNPQPLLPEIDCATIYQLNTVSYSGLVAGQDYPISYSSYRQYYSTSLVYDNAGVYNVGSDINKFSLRSANQSTIWESDPEMAALLARTTFLADPPLGTYWFNHSDAPISLANWGNMQLVVNPSAVTTGASIRVGFEYTANATQIGYAPSLVA
jgi:hypothetical protein